MKRFINILLISIVFIFTLTGCSNKHIKEISFKEFEKKIENKDTFAVYIGNKDCVHCVAYRPILEEVLDEYDINIYHLDNSKLSKKELSKMTDYVNISGTPTVAFLVNGEEESTLDRIVGESDKETTIEKFKANGYIK